MPAPQAQLVPKAPYIRMFMLPGWLCSSWILVSPPHTATAVVVNPLEANLNLAARDDEYVLAAKKALARAVKRVYDQESVSSAGSLGLRPSPQPASADWKRFAMISSRTKGALPTKVSFMATPINTTKPVYKTAPLDEDGYAMVAALSDAHSMSTFFKRVMHRQHVRVTNFRLFRKILRFFDGECSSQSFAALVDAVRKGQEDDECESPWLETEPAEDTVLLQVEEASQMGVDTDLKPIPKELFCLNHTADKAMGSFMQGVIQEMGGAITDYSRFCGFVPWYSGTVATQPYSKLVAELRSVSSSPNGWVRGLRRSVARLDAEDAIGFPLSLGKYAPMAQGGYDAVRLMGSPQDIERFVRRARKKDESMAHLVRGVVAEMGGVIAKREPLFNFAVKCRIIAGDDQISTIQRGILEAAEQPDSWVKFRDERLRALRQLGQGQFQRPIDEVGRSAAAKHIGKKAPLSEKGYRSVVSEGDTPDMVAFMHRVMANEKLILVSPASLKSFAAYHSGECGTQTYDQLVFDLHRSATSSPYCGGGWVTLSGDSSIAGENSEFASLEMSSR